MITLQQMGKAAKAASRVLAAADTEVKNKALLNICEALVSNADYIIAQNAIDVENAKARGISDAMLDRLSLDKKRIEGIADGIKKIVDLPDPIGEVISMDKQKNGLLIGKRRVPIGVIGIIYESRPNVTADAAALSLKSGNACILRGGSDAINSNIALAQVMKGAIEKAGLLSDCVQVVEDTSRQTATELMRLNDYIDLLIPRGGAGLIKTVVQTASVPVIETGTGNCHIYIDETADISMGTDIIVNAKTSRPGVCNAAETLLVHKDIAQSFLENAVPELLAKGVEIRGCEKTQKLITGITPATDEDWDTEFLDYILAVRVVDSIDMAIEHINAHNTGHSEAIVTNRYDNAQRFLSEVDAAAVYVNASTRFTDGYEFGLGAEIGISTQKMHARGPMGLKELTTIKYIIYGSGQIR